MVKALHVLKVIYHIYASLSAESQSWKWDSDNAYGFVIQSGL